MIEVTFVCDLCKKRELQTPDRALSFYRISSATHLLTTETSELVQDSESYWSVCASCHEAFKSWGGWMFDTCKEH